jgi:putative ABC transport system substrate-binding protein
MRRRDFLTLLGGAATALPLPISAQQSAMPVIGFLNVASPDTSADRLRAFRRGLKENGYVEGQNVAIEYRWANNEIDRLPELMADLVRMQVTVIAVSGLATVLAAKAATTTIPIVFTVGVDPVEVGLVTSLNRPGSNLTGVTNLNVELGPKRLELLHELVPTATIVALLVNPTNANAVILSRDLLAAARTLRVQAHVLHASTEHDFDTVFATLAQLRASALMIGTDPLFGNRSEQLGAMTVRQGVPAIFQYREFVAAGGLMSYGAGRADSSHQVGVYTARILKGEKPADLPVLQSTKQELIINLKTAKALGLTVPLSLLGRADEVIE